MTPVTDSPQHKPVSIPSETSSVTAQYPIDPEPPPPQILKRSTRTNWRAKQAEKESFEQTLHNYCPELQYRPHTTVTTT